VTTRTLPSPFLAFVLGLAALIIVPTMRADSAPNLSPVENAGDGTFRVTCTGRSKFTRDVTHLKAAATDAAEAYCKEQGKFLKVVSTTEHKGIYLVGDFPSVTVVFKALSAADPATPVPTATIPGDGGDFHSTLIKLDDLRKKGIISEEEFQTAKKKVLGGLLGGSN
jgi:hypothetical protein